jgi:ABC-type transport system substrate-binding protein
VVERYAVPSIHMLIPNLKNDHMRNAAFRKAILHAIDRQTILDSGLLAGADIPGCQVISGPFPLGINENDPISYGYNIAVQPARADYYLSVTLLLLADQQIKDKKAADAEREALEREKRGEAPAEPPPQPETKPEEQKADAKPKPLPRPTIVIAYPQNDVASVACGLIAQQLSIVGIKAELRALPPGQTVPEDTNYDLLYAEIVMEEPLVDARAFLVESKLVYDLTSPVEHALRELDGATSWAEARRRLHDLHFQCDSESIVLPLWQMTEHYAYRKNVRGLGGRAGGSGSAKAGLTNFYDNADRWRIVPEQAEN